MYRFQLRQAMVVTLVAFLALPVLGIGPARDDERYQIASRTFDVLERASRRTPVELRGIPLKDGLVETILVEEFDVFAPDARVHVIDGDEERIEAPPRMRFFKGQVLGHPGSWAVFTQSDQGLTGLISVDEEVYTIEEEKGSFLPRYFTRRVDDDELPESVRNWKCEADKYRVDDLHKERVAAAAVAPPPVSANAFTTNVKRRLRVAIDSDYELYVLLGSNSSTVTTYMATVTAAVSAIYENDLNTVLNVGDTFVYTSSSDPWSNSTDNGTLLGELGTYWHNTGSRSSLSRSTVVMISGKDTGGGVAWLGVLCRSTDFFDSQNGVYGGGYGVWGSVTGAVNPTNPNAVGYWDVLAYAHEFGHNANSDHTHCIASTGYGRTFVDLCRSGEGEGCWAGAESVPAEKGTIMSYCHLLAPGYSNVRMIFGKSGEASEAVLPPMTSHINSTTFSGTLTSGAGSTVDAGSTGNTATFTQASATSWTWEITNGTITGGQGTATVTYTAGTSGTVDFKVTAVNSKGCGAVATGSLDIVGGGGGTPGDANGDGKADIFWRNQQSGVNAIWLMNGGALAGGALLPTVADANMYMEGFGDFNADGKTDIVWRNIQTGANAIWLMNGTSIMSGAFLPTIADVDMFIVGTGDFNGDGSEDVLWRNLATGDPAVWLMNGTSIAGGAFLPNVTTALEIQAVGDLNGDNKDDIVFRDPNTGVNAVWFMNGTSIASGAFLPTVGGANFNFVGSADFNNDGKDDLLWRDSSSGVNAVWLMNGATVMSGAVLPTVTTQMYIGALGDFNGDGKADIAWRNGTTGGNAMWMMNGAAIMSGAFLPDVADTGMNMEGPW